MNGNLVERALVSGSVAAAAVTLGLALLGKRFAGSSAAPLNATSHALWGRRAGRKDDASLKYTATGLFTNYGAAFFWALGYEALAGRKPSRARALASGAAVSAAAYVVDYHVVPKRLTPGWEMRLPGTALAGLFGAFALGLAGRDLLFGAQPGIAGGKRPRKTMRRYAERRGLRGIMRQAKSDIDRGLEDTDCYGAPPSSRYCP